MSFNTSSALIRNLFSWLIFSSLLACAVMGQCAFLSSIEKQSFIPYLIWPPVVFFFLHHKTLSSVILLIFVSILSSVFSSLTVLTFFLLYLFCFFQIFFIKKFFFSKAPLLFLSLVFILSFSFPYLVDGAYDFSVNDFSLSTAGFYFLKALSTVFLSFFLFPLLKKYLQSF